MKHRSIIILAILGVLTLLNTPLFAQGIGGVMDRGDAPYLVVTYVEGPVQIRRATGGEWEQAIIGMVLEKDDIIRTAPNGVCTLTITKGGTIYLKESSVLIFERHEYDPVFKTEESVIKLRIGDARVIKPFTAQGSKFYVLTPRQSNLVTGTDFAVRTDGATSTVSVFVGSVRSANIEGLGNPVTVTAGFQSTTDARTPPTTPTPIPDDYFIFWNALSAQDRAQRAALAREQGTNAVTTAPPQTDESSADATDIGEDERIRWEDTDDSGENVEVEQEATSEPEPEPEPEPATTQTNTNAQISTPAETNEVAKKKRPEQPREWEFEFGLDGGVGVAFFDDQPYDGPLPNWWISIFIIPEITFGPIGVGFYLPFYLPISGDLTDARNWYNYDEWDFSGAADFFDDLSVKLIYVQYKWLPVWVRFGTLPPLTFGNGYLLAAYENSKEFPVVRNNGIYAQGDFDIVGLELFTDNIARNNFVGARLYARPFRFLTWDEPRDPATDFRPSAVVPESGTTVTESGAPKGFGSQNDLLSRIYVGSSLIFDAQPFSDTTWIQAGRLFNGNSVEEVAVYGINIDASLDVYTSPLTSVVLYADAGFTGLRFGKVLSGDLATNADPVTAVNTNASFSNEFNEFSRTEKVQIMYTYQDAFYPGEGVHPNQAGINGRGGFSVGAKGYWLILPWKAELRYSTAGHYPNLFDALYYEETTRLSRIVDLYINQREPAFGFLAETGLAYERLASFSLRYTMDLDFETGDKVADKLLFIVTLDKGVVPGWSGSFTYERTDIEWAQLTLDDVLNEKTTLTLRTTYDVPGPFLANVVYTRRFEADASAPNGLQVVNNVDFSIQTEL